MLQIYEKKSENIEIIKQKNHYNFINQNLRKKAYFLTFSLEK